jgi:hypothetical protein
VNFQSLRSSSGDNNIGCKTTDMYYSIIQSTQGAPYETKGTVTIEAGKTQIVDVNF